MTTSTASAAPQTLPKYLAALLHIAIVLSGAIAAVVDKPITLTVALQLAVLAAGSVVTYLVPLLDGPWQSGLKTVLGGVVPAIVAAALPFIPGLSGHLSAQSIIPVIAAILAAVGTELGVSARTDSVIDAGSTAGPQVPVITTAAAPSSSTTVTEAAAAAPAVAPADPAAPGQPPASS